MPPTADEISDKPVFDVYAMLLVLSFVFTGGAALLINADLTNKWNFWSPKGDIKQKWYITQMNDKEDQFPKYTKLRKEDLDDWKRINGVDKFTVSDYEWPEGFDPLVNPVLPNTDNLAGIPEAARTALMKGYSGPSDASVPEKAPESKESGGDKTEAPKTDAPKTDAPKTDTPAKVDAPAKADEPKADAPKAGAAKDAVPKQ